MFGLNAGSLRPLRLDFTDYRTRDTMSAFNDRSRGGGALPRASEGAWSRSGSRVRIALAAFALIAVAFVPVAEAQQSPPTFSKSFSPDTIGPGSVSTLRFDIVNLLGGPATAVAFTDNLPANVTIATPANAASSCQGDLSAPAGGTTIGFSGGRVEGSSSCAVTVDVTSSTPGTYNNISGDLTSTAGNSGSATDDLTVTTALPTFTKDFAPSSVTLGGRSTLTFTIDNSANASLVANLDFTDNLPAGMVIADPNNASTDCISAGSPNTTVVATPGTGVVRLDANGAAFAGFEVVPAGAMCTVTVDVTAAAIGTLDNVTEELLADFVSSGKASNTLEVTVTPLALTKSFTDDPVTPGGTVTLEFSVRNLDRGLAATQISFTDDLDATLSGLAATGLPLDDPCGQGSQLTGTGVLSLSGGSLGPAATCTFSVTLDVPAGTASGAYPNTTSQITAEIGGSSATGDPAMDTLFVSAAPTLTKEFIDDPVGAGDSVVLEFTIDNTSNFDATDIAFEDVFDVILKTASSVPADDSCGAGSTATFTPLSDPQGVGGSSAIPAKLVVSGASLAAGASCSFSITLDVAVGASGGAYGNTTSEITATVDGETVVGHPANDDLVVVGGPTLNKEFIDDPVLPGGAATLRFTLSHDANALADATAISFSDDLTFLTGLAAIGLPLTAACDPDVQDGNPGTGTLSGTALMDFSGATLAPGQECSFDVTLTVPAGAPAGSHTNETSSVTATVAGSTVTENPASDDLKIAGLALTKEFTDDPALPGGNVELSYTVRNTSPNSDTTDIFFSDNLDEALDGLAATVLPAGEVCGTGSSLVGLAGNTRLELRGGNLLKNEECTFAVTLLVPAGAADDRYPSRTDLFSAKFDGSLIALDNASDDLTILSDSLLIAKEFTDDPATPGGTVNLEFTLSNIGGANITGITFTDDLVGALPGLASSSGTQSDICGLGSEISGTTLLTFSGGSLAPQASCTFNVTVSVDSNVPNGEVATNSVDDATGLLDGQIVTADEATANLVIAGSRNFPPSIQSLGVAPEPSNEGLTVTASATFSGPAGTLDTDYSCTVDYGDGSGSAPGSIFDFTCIGPAHVYGDNGTYLVTATVTDQALLSDTESTDHEVYNVVPMVSAPATSPSPSDEGSAVTASATFSDPGGLNDAPFGCTVDYGDGPEPGTINGNICTGPAHTYGDNGSYTVTVAVADKDGGVGTASAPHTVDNVAPTVSAPVVTPEEPTDEGDSVTASATFSDPGDDDTPFTCTVDYGDGAGAANGSVSGLTCTGSSHTYGDNGTYTVTVSVTDKDGDTGSNGSDHQVDNLDPTVSLHPTDVVEFPGGEAFIGRQGVPQEHEAQGHDDGSDDLTFYWDFPPVHSEETTYFNDTGDPFGSTDPPKSSAGTFPFNVTDTATVTFPEPGVFGVYVDIEDDDGGENDPLDPQELAKLVSGAEVCVRSHGFWRHQFTAKKPHFDNETLQAYLYFVNFASLVFSEEVDAGDPAAAGDVLDTKKTKRDKANLEALAAWLNIASGAAAVDDVIEFADGSTETVLALMFMVEGILLDPDASDEDLNYAKDLAEAVNYLVKPDCDESSFQSLFNYGIEVEFGDGCWVAYIPSPEECIGCKTDSSSEELLMAGVAKVGGDTCSAYGGTYLKILDHRLEWQITNTGGESITIDRITLYWPGEYGDLRKITVRNVTIFDHVMRPASTTIDSGWRGNLMDRQIEPGATKKLKLEFGNARESETRDRRSE